MRHSTAMVLLATACAVSGCGVLEPKGTACPLVAYEYPAPVVVNIRDQSGAAAALGSTVTFVHDDTQFRDSTFADSLTVSGGTYGIEYELVVTKPYYAADTIHGALATGEYNGCGRLTNFGKPDTVQATVTLLPGAPPVRTLFVRPITDTLVVDRDNPSVQLTPVLDADQAVSHAISWEMSGDTASLGFDPATGIASSRCRTFNGYITIVAKAVADTTVTYTTHVFVPGHPSRPGDPPCS